MAHRIGINQRKGLLKFMTNPFTNVLGSDNIKLTHLSAKLARVGRLSTVHGANLY
jgi:hypothetical protein